MSMFYPNKFYEVAQVLESIFVKVSMLKVGWILLTN